MAWGADIMMLGRVPGALGAVGDSPVTVDTDAVAGYAGQYIGSWVGGGLVGYLVLPQLSGAWRGGLAASSIWQVSDAITGRGLRSPLMTGLLGVSGLAGLVFAWRSGHKRRR